ncbi:hypothetical protein HG531_006939 [Fusarium graminearum]|nr:hypothetical protein HG531_006939 [Fusarium graminearum]
MWLPLSASRFSLPFSPVSVNDNTMLWAALFLVVVESHGALVGHKLAHSGVIGVDPGLEPLGEEVTLLLNTTNSTWHELADASGLGITILHAVGSSVGDAVVVQHLSILKLGTLGALLNSLLLNLKRTGQVVEKRVESLGHGHVEQDAEDKEDDHQSSGACSLGDNKHSNEADLGKINPDKELLQSPRVNKASSVNLGLGDKENVVTTSPSKGAECGPLVVHGSRGAGKELVQKVEDDAADDLSQDAGSDTQTLNNKHGEDLAGILDDGDNGRNETVGKCLDEEDLKNQEDEVGVLRVKLSLNHGHKDGQSNRRQKTRDDTENDLKNKDTLDPSKAGKSLDGVDLGDNTDNSNRNGPEDDENSNNGGDDVSTDDNLPPRELETVPDNLVRLDANVSRCHVEGMVVSGSLESSLSIRLGVEFNKDSRVLLVVTSEPVGLGLISLGDESLEFLTAPFNGINLFANKSKRASAVREKLELGLSVAASGIDGEKDGPCDAKTDEADGAADAKESDKQRAQIGSGRIETPIGFTQYEKDEDVGRRRNEDGD